MSLWRRVVRERRTIVLPVVVLVIAAIGTLLLGVFPLRRHVASLEEAAINLGASRL